jgi:hypothetical protein
LNIWRRGLRWAETGAGWLLAYVAVCGGIGFLIRSALQDGPSCTPFNGLGGVIESHCDKVWVNLIWVVLLSLPRLAVLFPAICFALVAAAIRQGDLRVASNALPFLAISIPLVLVAWLGGRHWLRRDRAVGWGMLILVAVEIGALAIMA